MKQCDNCGHFNPLDAKFCNQCGATLEKFENGSADIVPASPKKLVRLAERRQLTILFCDLVGSTPLSEKLDAEEYRTVITNYHRVAEKEILRHGGFIAQYLGDGLLVYFGYPEGLEDAPIAAVRAGLDILNAVAAANTKWLSEGKTPIMIRIGIHTGIVVVDDHLALGETVNIAARLEGLAPHNGLVISPQTMLLVEGWFAVESLGKLNLKGITEPMEIFQVIREGSIRTSLGVRKARGLSPLVGREEEMAQLIKNWDLTKNGTGNFVLLTGEAGIGKSRLVDTLKERLSANPEHHLLEARCSTYQINSAFHPLIQLIQTYILHFDPDDDQEAKLDKLRNFVQRSEMDFETTMSLFVEFFSMHSEKFIPLVISPFAKRQKIMGGITQMIASVAGQTVVLFIIEDLHWADPSTLEWLGLSLNALCDKKIMTLCTTRPNNWPDWMEENRHTIISLKRLTSGNIANLCHHQTQGKVLPDNILNQINRKTEGVPLFVEELTKMILESGLLVEKEETFELTGTLSSIDIPYTLKDSLMARLDRLSDVRDIVEMASVIGREFTLDMLERLLEVKIDSHHPSMKKLLNAEIFEQLSKSKQQYQFKHALIQDTAYDAILRSRKQQLHYRVANIIETEFEELSQTQPELLAHHYTEGSEKVKAIPFWLQAGEHARKKNAMSEAIVHLQKGLNLLPEVEQEEERNNLELDFRLTLGGTYSVSHGFPHPKVAEEFNRALDIAQNIKVDQKVAMVSLGLFGYYFNRENYQELDRLSAYVSQLAEHPEMGYWFELIGNQINSSDVIKGNFESASSSMERVVELFDPSLPFPWELAPSGYLEIGAKSWWMICLHALGKLVEARALFDTHLSYAKEHSDSMTLYHIYTFPALYSLFAREWQSAETIIGEYLPIVRRFGDPVFMLTAEVYQSIAQAYQGSSDAFGKAVQLVNTCFDIGFLAFGVSMSGMIGELYFQFGEYDTAIEWNDKILKHVALSGSHIHDSELHRIKGLCLNALGKSDAMAEKHLKKAIEIARKQAAKTFELRATTDLASLMQKRGEKESAIELLSKILDWFPSDFESKDLLSARDMISEWTKN